MTNTRSQAGGSGCIACCCIEIELQQAQAQALLRALLNLVDFLANQQFPIDPASAW
jgi:hypothetical protein